MKAFHQGETRRHGEKTSEQAAVPLDCGPAEERNRLSGVDCARFSHFRGDCVDARLVVWCYA